MKILIAEDDQTSRIFMVKYLSRYGTCDVALNGIEAIEMFKKSVEEGEVYDLICLDIMMPKIDGIKALETIRSYEKKSKLNQTKIIMTSALYDDASVEESFNFGCDSYAWKPIDIKKFSENLSKLGLI